MRFINSLPKAEVIIVGDFNARCGNCNYESSEENSNWNFIAFFKELYSKQARIENQEDLGIKKNVTMDLDASLNAEITLEELDNCIKRLKAKKAVAEDKIANEFLKHSTNEIQQAILKVFNECINHGVYPWITALVTPILKKGSIYDPNNYWVVAVGSKIGKLFSSIFLDRLLVV